VAAAQETIAYIALGGNVGDVEAALRQAAGTMGRTPGIRVLRVSRLSWTQPVGGPPGQGRYLNGVAEIATTLRPRELLQAVQAVEASLGRDRGREVRWGPRTCDLDIVLMGDHVVDEPDLVIPHPRMHQRRFVLDALAELAPAATHPVLHKTMAQLLRELDEPIG